MMRRWAIWGALIMTLAACWWVEQNEPSAPETVADERPQVPRKVTLEQMVPTLKADSQTPVLVIAAPANDEAGVNLFGAMPVSLAETAALEVPAPANPYTYAGRLQEEGRWVIFLTDGQQQYVLREGEHFGEGWQVAVLNQQKVVLQHAAERFEIRLDNGVVF
jgi:hypothetical protein